MGFVAWSRNRCGRWEEWIGLLVVYGYGRLADALVVQGVPRVVELLGALKSNSRVLGYLLSRPSRLTSPNLNSRRILTPPLSYSIDFEAAVATLHLYTQLGTYCKKKRPGDLHL